MKKNDSANSYDEVCKRNESAGMNPGLVGFSPTCLVDVKLPRKHIGKLVVLFGKHVNGKSNSLGNCNSHST